MSTNRLIKVMALGMPEEKARISMLTTCRDTFCAGFHRIGMAEITPLLARQKDVSASIFGANQSKNKNTPPERTFKDDRSGMEAHKSPVNDCFIHWFGKVNTINSFWLC